MAAHEYQDLLRHVGHELECVQYGDGANVAIECIECGEVIVDYDHPENEMPEVWTAGTDTGDH